MDALLTGPAWRMAEAVRAGTISPRELVTAQIARAEALNPAVNAIVVPRYEQALEEAARSDRAPDAPLRGVPFTVKECIPVAGLPSGSRTCGPRPTPPRWPGCARRARS